MIIGRSAPAKKRRSIGDLGHHVRCLPTDAMDFLLKERDRVVIGPALHILRQTDEGRAAIRQGPAWWQWRRAAIG